MNLIQDLTVEVPRQKLELLEQEHDFLAMIRGKSSEVTSARDEWQQAKDYSLEKKKAFDRLSAELNDLIVEGPPKPDPQGRLPFEVQAEEDDYEDLEDDDLDDDEEPAAEPVVNRAASAKSDKVKIPAFIDALNLPADKKLRLAETGAKSIADLVSIGNGNWSKYPKGFASLQSFGPRFVEQLVAQLPKTVSSEPAEGVKLRRIKLLAFQAGKDRNLEANDEWEAEVDGEGIATIRFPGEESFLLQGYEYELVD